MPYAPGIQYRGDQYIAQGNQAAWSAVGDAVQGLMAQSKLSKALGSTIDAVAETLPDDQQKTLKAQNKVWGLPERQGFLQAQSLKQAMQGFQQQVEQHNLAIAEAKRKADAETALAAAVRGAGQMDPAETLALGQGPIVPPRVTPTPQRLLQAVTRNPEAANTPGGREILQQAMQTQDETLTPDWIEDPKTGMRFLGRGRTTLPSGVNPSVSTSNLPSVPGYTPAPTGRGGVTWLKTPDGKLDVNGNIKLLQMQQDAVLKDYLLPVEERTARLGEINSAIEEMRGSNGAPTAETPQKVTTKKQFDALKSGAIYIGKDGKKYRKP